MPIDLLEMPDSHIKLESADTVEKVLLETDKKICLATALNNIVKKS